MANFTPCKDAVPCDTDNHCDIYDLCEVRVTNVECGETDKIVCEGFKFTARMNSEILRDSSCYEGYGYKISEIEYTWEITNPCDRAWFDKRFVNQICDRYSMEITGYAQKECGEWEPIETLSGCIIDETGREYGKGVSRTLSGKALRRKVIKGDIGSTWNGYTTYSQSKLSSGNSGGNGGTGGNSGFQLFSPTINIGSGNALASGNSVDMLSKNNAFSGNSPFSNNGMSTDVSYNNRRLFANKVLNY